jgi:hypothetical protein
VIRTNKAAIIAFFIILAVLLILYLSGYASAGEQPDTPGMTVGLCD